MKRKNKLVSITLAILMSIQIFTPIYSEAGEKTVQSLPYSFGTVKVIDVEYDDNEYSIRCELPAKKDYGEVCIDYFDEEGNLDFITFYWNEKKHVYIGDMFCKSETWKAFRVQVGYDKTYYADEKRVPQNYKYPSLLTYVLNADFSIFDFNISNESLLLFTDCTVAEKGSEAYFTTNIANTKVAFTSSNKKIAKIKKQGNSNGTYGCTVSFLKPGKVTITAKKGNEKKYCTLTVKKTKPHFYVSYQEYDTHSNVFKVKIKNTNYVPVTIYSSGAKAYDSDYKTFDRSLYLSGGKKSITVKPGKTKTLKFKVKGKVTWYKEDDFTIYFTAKLDGKKYKMRTWFDVAAYYGDDGEETITSEYKSGSKWKDVVVY